MMRSFSPVRILEAWRLAFVWLVAVAMWVGAWLQPWDGERAPALLGGVVQAPLHAGDGVMLYLRWGFLAGAVCWTLAALLGRWWVRLGAERVLSGRAWTRREIWVGVALLLVFLVTRLPLMERGMTRDEQYDHSESVQGRWEAGSERLAHLHTPLALMNLDGLGVGSEAVWRPVTWVETLHGSTRGSNSPGFSALSRVVHAGWVMVTGRDAGLASVVAMRLPALIFGLLVVWVFWRGLVGMGGLWAGTFAVLWLMLHPLFLGYSTEARCYTLVLLVEVLVLGALVRVMKGGRARDWLVLQGGSAMLIYLFPWALSLVVGIQGVAGWVCLRSPEKRFAWLACGLMGAGALLAIGLPSLVDRYLFMRDRYPFTEAFPGWWLQVWNLHAAGFSWPSFDAEGLPGVGAGWGEWAGFLMERGWRGFPLESTLGLVVVPILVVRGAFVLWCRGKKDALLIGVLPVLAAVLTVLHHVWVTGYLVLAWYFVFVLPGLAVLLAAGLGLWAERPGRSWVARVPAVIFLVLFVFGAWPNGRVARLSLWSNRESRQVGYQQGREVWVTSKEGKITRYEPVRRERTER